MIDLTNGTLLISITSLIGLLVGVFAFSHRLGSLETKVNTMWAFQMRRAFSEVVSAGVGEMKSPLVIRPSAKQRLLPIRNDLLHLATEFEGLADPELALKIEERFGDDLLKLICVPCGLSHGACLMVAIAVARERDCIELK